MIPPMAAPAETALLGPSLAEAAWVAAPASASAPVSVTPGENEVEEVCGRRF